MLSAEVPGAQNFPVDGNSQNIVLQTFAQAGLTTAPESGSRTRVTEALGAISPRSQHINILNELAGEGPSTGADNVLTVKENVSGSQATALDLFGEVSDSDGETGKNTDKEPKDSPQDPPH